ncbi:MAG TPA: UDP-3-O-(3-hydroxymyristoyl)glucosamine N-acyltransferase [Candidatus Polarisedimenticolaceae bacterium]|nr:UDP-3-O-(3-hydroxymyristoyl)glucosamine N-acyltransferase [Candidatus Polarisedimenticolaceae bacterium]
MSTERQPARFKLSDLAAAVGGRVLGDPERTVTGVATLEGAGPDDLSFLTNLRYRQAADGTRAGAVLVGPDIELAGHDLLQAPEPYLALAVILERMHPDRRPDPGVSADARVSPSARLGEGVSIAPFAVVEAGATVGDGTAIGAGSFVGERVAIGPGSRLYARVVVYAGTAIGARCVVHAGAVLGADGFGFATSRGVHRKVPQIGRVVLEDDVEIGANTTVDRGSIGDTRIGAGSKIDNLVMIAHGVVVGPGALIAAQVGVAGSTRIGHHAMIGGQAGFVGHLAIGDRVIVGARGAVYSDLDDGRFVAGNPAMDHRTWKRSQAILKELPEMRARIRALERRLQDLDGKAGSEA